MVDDKNDINEFELRKKKLTAIGLLGFNPNPDRFDKTHNIVDILKQASDIKLPQVEGIVKDAKIFNTAGRLMTIRGHGKITFANLQDAMDKIQICFKKDNLSKEQMSVISNFDLGDYLGVSGRLFQTHKGETTLLVDEFIFLGKALRPLPEKFHGLKDKEALYRQRYLDLLSNPKTKERFYLRSRVIKFFRDWLDKNDFTEVETPILSSTASGALAKPFITHHNALDADFYLRIAPETYLKRLIVGGFERVYEIGKCFRNEGIDPSHLQEFTMMEYYASFWNWQDNIKFTEKMISALIKNIFGKTEIDIFGKKVNWKPPYPVIEIKNLIYEHCQIDIEKQNTAESLKLEIAKKEITIDDIASLGYGNLVDALYKKVARPKIIDPIFLVGHPIALSPLARANDDNPEKADRFQLVVMGWEIVNAYSELVDSQEQRKRLKEQADLKAAGDEEAMMMDEDYLKSMEYGMPPISGWGMGIDRLVALLTGQENLKDCIFFPLMKTKDQKKSITKIKDIEISMVEAGIDRKQAIELLQKYLIDDDYLYKHSLAVEAVMRAFAKYFNRNIDVWGLAGLLHDIDYPETKHEPVQHGLVAEKILTNHGLHPEIIYAIKAHNYLHELSLDTLMAKTLYSIEELTGFITACALVQPGKRLSSVSIESMIKKFKQKSFASGVNRSIVMKSEEYLEMPLDKIFGIALVAMQEIAGELEL